MLIFWIINFAILLSEVDVLQRPIVKVISHCPSSNTGQAIVNVYVDWARSSAYAVCARSAKIHFINHISRHELPIEFPGNRAKNDSCKFNVHKGTLYYTIKVHVALHIEGVELKENVYRVSCLYNDYSRAETLGTEIVDMMAPGNTLHYVEGGYSRSGIAITVLDESGKSVPMSKSVLIGTKIRLRLQLMYSTVGEKSFQVLACRAYGLYGSFTLIESGCGDGIALRVNEGFTTQNSVAVSAPFEAFRFRGSDVVRYECHVIMCDHHCDGPSCVSRKKRDTHGPRLFVRSELRIRVNHSQEYKTNTVKPSLSYDIPTITLKGHQSNESARASHQTNHVHQSNNLEKAAESGSFGNFDSQIKNVSMVRNRNPVKSVNPQPGVTISHPTVPRNPIDFIVTENVVVVGKIPPVHHTPTLISIIIVGILFFACVLFIIITMRRQSHRRQYRVIER